MLRVANRPASGTPARSQVAPNTPRRELAAVGGYDGLYPLSQRRASPMFREPVSSSMIAAIAYDEETETLEVEFASGAIYRYRGIRQDAFEDFRAAPSKGRFFNAQIRDAYPWEKVAR